MPNIIYTPLHIYFLQFRPDHVEKLDFSDFALFGIFKQLSHRQMTYKT